MLYQMKEWETISNKWHCNCVDNLAQGSGEWYLPARILGISPAAYLEYVIKNFKPDDIYANKEKCLVFFSWNSQADCRKFKNFINRKAREKNFQI